jgi:hypothetical protein
VDIVSDRSELGIRDIAGRLAIEADRGGQSRLEDIRGSLDLEADRTDVVIAFSKLDARSSIDVDRGDVRIEVPSAQGLALDADLTRRSGFDSDMALDKRRGDEHRFTADVNGGGPTLTLESDRGRIRLVQGRSRP